MKLPLISVVISVRNGEENIEKTILSVLNQEKVDLELIVIDDGSLDKTGDILNSLACLDSRIQVLRRVHRGLTTSLIEACELARGELIARHDVGDISLPGRLYQQATALAENNDASMCSCNVRFLTREGEVVLINEESTERKLGYRGIIHGSVMMRKNTYKMVGGYRSEFYYAQDIDLWSRLIDVGKHIVIPSILYEGLLVPNSISGARKREQDRLSYFIKRATRARRSGKSEDKWLKQANDYSMKCKSSIVPGKLRANGAYFIGACLINKNPTLAAEYFKEALTYNPIHIRARIKLANIKTCL